MDAPALALGRHGCGDGHGRVGRRNRIADVALASDDLHGMATTVGLSRRTMRVIRQNYGLALGTNAVGLYLGAMGTINPIIAAVLHNLSTLLVVGNSTRLINFDPDLMELLQSGAANRRESRPGCFRRESFQATAENSQGPAICVSLRVAHCA
jgi:manganese/zinc-transporting P-type ATPase C